MSEWQDIATAPKDGTVFRATKGVKGRVRKDDRGETFRIQIGAVLQQYVAKEWHRPFFQPTHWRPQ